MATSIEELVEYLIEHPEDHETRWRLCKKLYTKRAYEDVLPHLEQLKEDWKPKRNLDRYLAATYYRMKEYDKSIAILEEAVERWPEEAGLREQLARVYEVSGNKEAAAREWEIMYRLDPERSSAGRAIDRLRDSGIDPTSESDVKESEEIVLVCGECGAKNSPDFELCWRCKSLLTLSPTPTPIEFVSEPDLPVPSTSRLLLSGLASVAVLASSVYFTLRYVAPQIIFGLRGAASDNLFDGVHLALAFPRAASGIAALIVCPTMLWLGVKAARAPKLPPGQPWTLGVFVAGVLYVGQWAPLPFLPHSLVVSLAVALLALLISLPLKTLPRAAVSLVTFVITVAAAGSAFVVIAGLDPITNTEAINVVRANSFAKGAVSPRRAVAPYEIEHRFTPTGSAWLDRVIGVVGFDIEASNPHAALTAEYVDAAGTVIASKSFPGKGGSIGARVAPDQMYRLTVKCDDRYEITVRPVCAVPIVYSP